MNNVLFVGERRDNPCWYYRMELPSRGLTGLGVNARIAHAIGQRPDGKLIGLHNNGVPMDFVPDAIVARRLLDQSGKPMSSARLFRQAREQGQRVFLDVDDNMWQLPEWSPARAFVTDEVLRAWEKDAAFVDGVIVTTNPLADVVRQFNPNVHIIPNAIDGAAYEPYRNTVERTPFRLGWAGTTAYRWPDLEWLVPTLDQVLAEASVPVEFWHLGNVNSRAEPHLGELIQQKLGRKFSVPLRYVNWTDAENLPRSYTHVDALIIPQWHSPFNECRSAATGLAAMAAGIPYVATPTDEYRRMWNLGGGYLASYLSPLEWEQALQVLIAPEYREARRSMIVGGLAVAVAHAPHRVARGYLAAFGWDIPDRDKAPAFGAWA